jgi:hypothetical protein
VWSPILDVEHRHMKPSKRLRAILLLAALLLLAGSVLYRLAPREILRCYLVRWSDLDTIAPSVHVDPDMPESQRQDLLSSLADAQEQIAALYGDYTAEPVIIAGHTMEVMQAYGGNSYNRAGRTYLTLASTFIVLGPDGADSPDVLAHELAHTELPARIGHGHRDEIPNWFDEGLALQFDGRYTEAEWRARTGDGRTAPDLDQIGIIAHDDWLAYATAKHEVRRWLGVVGQEGLQALLASIQKGEDFYQAYHSMERD